MNVLARERDHSPETHRPHPYALRALGILALSLTLAGWGGYTAWQQGKLNVISAADALGWTDTSGHVDHDGITTEKTFELFGTTYYRQEIYPFPLGVREPYIRTGKSSH